MNNGTTIEQQISAVNGEVKSYVRSTTWHDHQKALSDAVETLKNERFWQRRCEIYLEQVKELENEVIELNRRLEDCNQK